MKHARFLALKFGYILAILFLVLGVFGNFSPTNILITAIVLTGFLYIIGDLRFQPNFGRGVASVTNGLLAGLILWATELTMVGFGLSFISILAVASLIGIVEFFFFQARQKLIENPDRNNE